MASARPLLQTLSQIPAAEAWVLGEGASLWSRQTTGKEGVSAGGGGAMKETSESM